MAEKHGHHEKVEVVLMALDMQPDETRLVGSIGCTRRNTRTTRACIKPITSGILPVNLLPRGDLTVKYPSMGKQ